MQSALFIGRFQPFHNGHLSVVKSIIQENERLIIGIGSAEQNFLPGDPLTAGERFMLIEETLKAEHIPSEKFVIIPIRNVNNYAIWVNHLNTYIPTYNKLYTASEIVKACYTDKYKRPDKENKTGPEIIDLDRNLIPISATEVRKAITEDQNWEHLVPATVYRLLHEWHVPERIKMIKALKDETRFNQEY